MVDYYVDAVGGYMFRIFLISLFFALFLISCDNSNATAPNTTDVPAKQSGYYCSKNGYTYQTEQDYQKSCIDNYNQQSYSSSSYPNDYVEPTYSEPSYSTASSASFALSSSSVTEYTKSCGSNTYKTTDETCYRLAVCNHYERTRLTEEKYDFYVGIAGCTNAWTTVN